MTWGSHCSNCGKEDCEWAFGLHCDGGTRHLVGGEYRLSYGALDFGAPGVYFFVEQKKKGWFRERWVEVNGTRAGTPQLAARALKEGAAET